MDIDNSYIRCSSSCYCCIFKVSLLIYELNSFRCGMIRALIEAIDQYKGEDPLQPWLQWVLFFWNKIDSFLKHFSYPFLHLNIFELFTLLHLLWTLYWLSCWHNFFIKIVKVHQVGARVFPSGWGQFWTCCYLWTMCPHLLARWPIQGWPPLLENVAGICPFAFFTSILLHLNLSSFWYMSLLTDGSLQAENCMDAEVIYSFLEANKIGQTHSSFYIAYALHMESQNKIKTANEIFNRGLSM